MRSRTRTSTFLLRSTALMGLLACGGTNETPSPFDAPAPDEGFVYGTPNEIIEAEIRQRRGNDGTAMALIRRLRPDWLRARGQNSFTDPSARYPIVYIDEIRHGYLATLNQIPSSEILRMEFYSQSDATTRWGTGHPAGVINIITGR